MQTLLKFLLIIATFTLLIVTYFHPITAITQDLGRHIKTGEIILKTMQIPKTNLYSYTYPNFPFINHHWGSEVIFYALYTHFGITATLLTTLLCSILAFGLLYWYSLKSSAAVAFDAISSTPSILAVSLVSFLSLGILFERTDVRPEAFSFLFTAIFLTILFKNREKPTRWLAALIPLQLLWVNTHVYFIIGIVLIGLFFLDAIFTALRHPELDSGSSGFQIKSGMTKEMLKQVQHDNAIKQLSHLFFVLVSCSLVTLFNPNGLSGALYPFRVFENYGYSIEENQNIFFLWEYAQKRTIVFFWVSVIVLFGTLFLRTKQTRPIDWLLSITFTILGIQAIRNFPLYVFAVFIPFTYQLSYVILNLLRLEVASPLGGFQDLKQKNHKTEMLKPVQHDKIKLGATIILLILFSWQLFFVLQAKPIGTTTPTGASNAVDFMMKHNIRGPIFNNFDIGSYLIFRLYPNEKIFVDGRPEAYPVSFFKEVYIPMQQNPQLFEKLDEKYGFNTIFFSHTDQTPWAKQFLHDIVKNKNWQPVYLDDTVIILVKKSLPREALAKWGLSSFHPASDSDTPALYQLFLFFQTTEMPQKQIEILQQIIQKDPSDCTALGLLLQNVAQNDPMIPIYNARFRTTCQ